MAEHVIAHEVAAQQLDQMEDAFGKLGQGRDIVLDAIMRGLIDFDDAKSEVTYRLERPSGGLKQITFHEPNVGEIKRINRGMTAETGTDGRMVLDMGMAEEQRIRMVSIVGGVPAAEVEKISRRDWAVLTGLSGFFG